MTFDEWEDDPYEVLGVPLNATESEIKKAYRQAALKYHPDRQQQQSTDKDHSEFARISAAYELLTNTDKPYEWRVIHRNTWNAKSKGSTYRNQASTQQYPSRSPRASATSYCPTSDVPSSQYYGSFEGEDDLERSEMNANSSARRVDHRKTTTAERGRRATTVVAYLLAIVSLFVGALVLKLLNDPIKRPVQAHHHQQSSQYEDPDPEPVRRPQCAENDGCKELGLRGDCCPTRQGILLSCCS